MMSSMKRINFLGLGFEVGQDKVGLNLSYEFAKTFFYELSKDGLLASDRGFIPAELVKKSKIFTVADFHGFDWKPFHLAYERIKLLLSDDVPLVNWGGDHSVALATVAAFSNQNPEGYVIWIDAHADLNLPEYSLTGHLHGMPLSILLNLKNFKESHLSWLGSALRPEKLIYLGIRDLDAFEIQMIRELGIKYYSTREILRLGMKAISEEILNLTQGHPLHISFDIDSISADYFPATGIPVADGLSWKDLEVFGRVMSCHSNIKSMDVVEINPNIGTSEQVFETYFYTMKFITALLLQGGIHDGIGRTNQELYATQMESSSQI